MLKSLVDFGAAPSTLAQFDPTELFDILSSGIVVLDGHLCAIYANRVAQEILKFRLDNARGRPFIDVVASSYDLARVFFDVLESDEYAGCRDGVIRSACLKSKIGDLTITTSIMVGDATGLHLLMEVGYGHLQFGRDLSTQRAPSTANAHGQS